jgi:peroxisomal 2,4-dienoyl-CoA reductase
VVFVTGGAGTICSAQTRALVHLGANACIIGRNVEKTEKAAMDISKVRKGAKIIGIGGVDVRKVMDKPMIPHQMLTWLTALTYLQLDSLQEAVDRCVKELGGIDFVM